MADLEARDWSEIPNDILFCIAGRLVDVRDIIRFGAVCRSWKPIYVEKRAVSANSQQIPMLLLSTGLNDDHNIRKLYNVVEKRVLKSEIHVPHNLYCPGSSWGWLVTVSEDYEICLLNPLKADNNKIVLPPLTSFTIDPQKAEAESYRWGMLWFLEKVVLSANPASNPNFIALAIYGSSSRLAYCKQRMNAWKSLSFKYQGMLDLVCYDNKFYAVNRSGEVYILHFNPPWLDISRVVVPPMKSLPLKRYIVESSGDLLQVVRHTDFDDNDNYFNKRFYVFKMNIMGNRMGNKWTEITNLSGCSLFLGHNTSVSILASDFPGCKPNCIYYTDDYAEMWNWGCRPNWLYYNADNVEIWNWGSEACAKRRELHDIGIFNTEDGSTEQHYPTEGKRMFPAPIWIQPTL